MTNKADLLGAVKRTSHKDIIGLATKSKAKKCNYSFQEVIKSLKEDETNELWDKLHKIVSDELQILLNPGSPGQKTSTKKMRQDICHFIQAVIDLALAVFEQSLPAPKSLLLMVILLNRNIASIPSTLEKMKNYIACLCERMYQLNYLYDENDKITVNTLLYLFKRILTTKGAKRDVKRIYNLRSKIPLLLTSSDLDLNDVRETLKKCVTSSVFLSATEGPAVIALILTADRDHILDIHESIIKRLSSCSLAQGSAYGQAYLRAWKHSAKTNSLEIKEAIESMCICDIIVFGIKSRSKIAVGAVRKLLSQFICQKKEPQISKLLHDAYLPILWRFLKSHDGLMRANAAMLFLDVFPLEDPDIKIVETDMELNEQMLLIQDLLVDDFPIVRSSTVIGLFIAMSVHWELFPEEMLKTYFKVIINDLSCDSSCADVRSAVVKGFKVLLENPLALGTLKPILPKINHMFHDVSDNVRVAFVQLLHRVKKIATIKYFDIVPIDHILARLEEDPIVAKSLVGLIQNSYFPKCDHPDTWIARCVQMVKKDRGASRIFFTFISSYIGIECAAVFMAQTIKAIHFYIKSKEKSTPIRVSRCNSNGSSIVGSAEALEEAVGFNDIDVVAGLMEGVAIMWLACSSQFDKPENKDILKRMVAKMSKCMMDLNIYYKDSKAWDSVYLLASFLPPRSINCLPSLCYHKLKQLNNKTEPKDYETVVDCLTNQNQIPELFGLLKDWIRAGFDKPQLLVDAVQTPHPKRRKSKKSIAKAPIDDGPKPTLAVKLLSFILERKSSQKVILQMHSDELKSLITAADKDEQESLLDVLKGKISQLAEEPVPFEEAEFYLIMFSIILDSAGLLHSECHQGKGAINAVDFMDKLIIWIEGSLLKHVTSNGQLPDNSKDATLEYVTLHLCKNLIAVLSDMSLLGYVNVKTLRFIKFSMKLLGLPIGPYLLCDVNRLMLRHTKFGVFYSLRQTEEPVSSDILRILPDCFSKIVHCIDKEEYMEVLSPAEMKEIQVSLAGSMALMQPHLQLKELVSSVSQNITKHVLESLFLDIEKWEKFEKERIPFKDVTISKSSAFILQALAVKPNLLVYFLQHLQNYLCKLCRKKRDDQSWVACFIIVLHILELKCHSKNMDREMSSMLVKMGELLNQDPPEKLTSIDNLMECDAVEESKEATPSFIEHCHEEYKKLNKHVSSKSRKSKKSSA